MIIEYEQAYGLWSLVIINALVFIIFAFSFATPRTGRDWRSLGAFSAFIVALFTEMYGFPLTIYLLSGWLESRYPGIDFLSHDAGHLLEVLLQALFGWQVDPHFGPFHVASYVLIFAGFFLIRGDNLDFLARVDWIVDLGPGGGMHGGELLFCGPFATFLDEAESPTARLLREQIAWRRRDPASGRIAAKSTHSERKTMRAL